MLHIPRFLKSELKGKLKPGKVVLLYGPRQVGKTTLVREILDEFNPKDILWVSGDNSESKWLATPGIHHLQHHIGTKTILAIDEAQKIPQIGLTLKLLVDNFPHLRLMVTGSSSFEIAQQVGAPLVGRQWEYTLFPIAELELATISPMAQSLAQLPHRLVLGNYPEILITPNQEDKIQLLVNLVDNYLYKDLLEFQDIRKADKIHDLLKLIAFQIGKDVSLHELGTQLGLDLRTIERYLDLLEKVFILKKVRAYSRNLRKEISKSARYYFLDNGIRNAIIRNFNSLENRDDCGALWENYFIAERIKTLRYTKQWQETYFWRTYDQQEIDWIEEGNGQLIGYEIKWKPRKVSPPSLWKKTYPHATFHVVSPENYLKFMK